MNPYFTGRCLCGAVQYSSSSAPTFQANCHCDDCRRSGGGAYASFVFVPASSLSVHQGETASYQHLSDSGNMMTKFFCPQCGSQLFTSNSGRPERRGIRVGTIDDASWFEPAMNVYTCRKLPSTLIDESVEAFEKMPG
ncbi:MAG: hypothetical protein GWN21_18295 [Gammaproteobacteria bacterium]|nr:GFA family protein [Gammaproteobacteria bacterium]NIV49724.1 hypothetical protein [Gammaproteobacteria bacterium]NIW57122.1 hypothetical protein [Gammaproteobacteria bacterium]